VKGTVWPGISSVDTIRETSSVLVTGVQHDDALALNGLGGEDTLDDSGLIPGGFALTFAQ